MANPIEIQFQKIRTDVKRLAVIKDNYGELLNIPNFSNEVQAFYDHVADQMGSWFGETKNALVEEGLDRLKKVAVIKATSSTEVKEVSAELPFKFKHNGVEVDTNQLDKLNAIYEKINGNSLLNVEQVFATIDIKCQRTANGFKLIARVAE